MQLATGAELQQSWVAMQYPGAAMMMMGAPPPPLHQQQHHHQGPPPGSRSSDKNKTIRIGDLHYWMDESYLHSCFCHTGEIFLEIPSKNRIIPFVFRPTDTINDLKAAIRKRGVWFDEKHHTLVFQKQKLPLDGERTLGDCGVEDRDTVLVYTHMPFVVCVYFPRKYVPPESFSFPVRVCRFDTIREVKVDLEEACRSC